MKSIIFLMMTGLLVGLAFATAVTYWFPVPHQVRSAWNPEHEVPESRAGLVGERAPR